MVEPGLPFKGIKTRMFPVELPDRRKPGEFRQFTIKITEVQTIDLDMVLQLCAGKKQAMDVSEIVLTGLQAINVALRRDPLLRFHQCVVDSPSPSDVRRQGGGGNRFFSPTERFAISGGAEVAAGFFQSARPSMTGLLLKRVLPLIARLTAQPRRRLLVLHARRTSAAGLQRDRRSRRAGRRSSRRTRWWTRRRTGGRTGRDVVQPARDRRAPVEAARRQLHGHSPARVTHRPESAQRAAKIDDITIKGADQLMFALGDSRSKSGDGPPPKQISVADYFKSLNHPLQVRLSRGATADRGSSRACPQSRPAAHARVRADRGRRGRRSSSSPYLRITRFPPRVSRENRLRRLSPRPRPSRKSAGRRSTPVRRCSTAQS